MMARFWFACTVTLVFLNYGLWWALAPFGVWLLIRVTEDLLEARGWI